MEDQWLNLCSDIVANEESLSEECEDVAKDEETGSVFEEVGLPLAHLILVFIVLEIFL
jgi:hypothetical protein